MNTQANITNPLLEPSKNIVKDLTKEQMIKYAEDGFIDFEREVRKGLIDNLCDKSLSPEFVDEVLDFLNEKVFDEVINEEFISKKYNIDEMIAFGRILEEWGKMQRIISQIALADECSEEIQEA